MQFIKCTREALLKPLQIVGGIVEGRQTLAILSHILVEKNGQSVTFTTTDLEIQIRTHAEIGIGEESVQTTLPANKLITLLNAIPGASSEVSLDRDEKNVQLRTSNGKYKLNQMSAAEYPSIPKSEMPTEVSLPSKTLRHLLQMVHFAMAQQDIRYYLNGLLFVIGNGFVRAVATDGHRLACCDAQSETEFAQPVEAILPRKTILQLLKLRPESDEAVQICLGESQAKFTFSGIEFITKVIDGKYPDYNRVIPTGNDKIFLVNREVLIGALKRVAILANEKFKGLRWVVSPGALHIQSTNSDMEEAVEDIAIDYQGEGLDLGFNVTYLLDVLSNLKNTEVRFAFSTNQGATLLSMPESDQFRYVLMPMRI